jgi:hypothetical protein
MHRAGAILGCLALAWTLHAAAAAEGQKTMHVQVKEGELRAAPSFLGAVVAPVKYGDPLEVLEVKGAWTRARVPQTETAGWIHGTALSSERVKLAAGSSDAKVAASSGELALAGKGFNKDVEAQFKANNKDVDFTWVDRMETFRVTARESQAFLREGGVQPRTGGAQ